MATDLNLPKHIGIIMDGNRRFATMLGEESWKGHFYGAEKVEEVLDWCRELNIKTLTVWAFSMENFSRAAEEVSVIMDIFVKYFNKFANDERVHKNKVQLKVVGNLGLFPKEVQAAAQDAMEKTKSHDRFEFNVVMGYGGRQEILDAAKKVADKLKSGEIMQVDKDVFESHLCSRDVPDVDLVIRTSGEQRTSGFLMWKSDYAEYYFCEKLWPEFEKQDLMKAIVYYSERKRRFGK